MEGQSILARHSGLAPVQREAAQAYLQLDPDLNLEVFAIVVSEAQPVMTSRISGDLNVIGPALQGALQADLYRNEMPFETAIQQAKSVVEAAIIK